MPPIDLLVTGRVAMQGEARLGVAVTGGAIVHVGPEPELRAMAGARTRLIEAAPDEVLVPGFTDAHLHLADAALAAEALDLGRTKTLDEALGLVAARHLALGAGEWLAGLGWQAGVWGRWPSADDLERAAPGRPALLWSYDHHAAWLSRTALAAAGIDDATPDPLGGRIARDASGHATGVLHENAVRLGMIARPAIEPDRVERSIERYAAGLVRLGIVAVHDPGPLAPDPGLRLDLASCARLAAAGRLPVRVHVSVRADSLPLAIERELRSGDDLLPADAPPEVRGRARVGWLKLFADGALGSRTAALLEPYRTEPTVPLPAGERGFLTTPLPELVELVERARRHGIATQIHAIGDAAVRAALDAFEEVAGGTGPTQGPVLPPRIEHAQLVDPADMARFARLGVVASVQPSHLDTDAAGAVAAWGDRAANHGYPYGDLARAGATLVFGSDAPVERADPWATLAFAVHRARGVDGPVLLGEHQRMALGAALAAMTGEPALAGGNAADGRIAAGAAADILIVSETALDAPWGARPTLVIARGEVYD